MVEDRLIVVFAGDDGDLVPGPGMGDTLVVDLGSKVVFVEDREGFAGGVHTPAAVAATNDGDQFASLLIVVGGDELDQRLLRDPPVRKATTYFRSRPHLFSRIVSPSPI